MREFRRSIIKQARASADIAAVGKRVSVDHPGPVSTDQDDAAPCHRLRVVARLGAAEGMRVRNREWSGELCSHCRTNANRSRSRIRSAVVATEPFCETTSVPLRKVPLRKAKRAPRTLKKTPADAGYTEVDDQRARRAASAVNPLSVIGAMRSSEPDPRQVAADARLEDERQHGRDRRT